MDTILFAGGDRRTLIAAEFLKRAEYSVEIYAVTERVPLNKNGFSAMILPFPCLKQGRLNAPLLKDPPTLSEVLAETGVDVTVPVMGGPLSPNPFPNYTDFSLREDLKYRNAVTTAEGALSLLIENTDSALFASRVLVVGFGAIGKRMARILQALGSDVTVAARKEKDRVDAILQGCKALPTDALDLEGFDVVVNTVPAPLLTESVLSTAPDRTLFLELASAPGGIFRDGKRKVVDGPALPGKVAPVTAGEDLAKTVISILNHT